ncbi:MAG: hypothetical protein WCF84_14380 [Anaerolineae bacterium]
MAHPVKDVQPPDGIARPILAPRDSIAGAYHLRFALRSLFIYTGLAVAVACVYLLLAQAQNGAFGFPLDDAWIHQVYARNLGMRGEFSFFSGQPSAGSTSPLWALVLAPAYMLHIDFRVWTVALGILCLGASAFFASRLARRLDVRSWVADWLVPLFIILEWHLTWASVSGMEILLFVLLSLALIDGFLAQARPLGLGLLAGLLTLTRPEGIVLAGLVVMSLSIRWWLSLREPVGSRSVWTLLQTLVAFGASFLLLLVPYALFNLWTSGTILPNTFYAKSQEYAELLQNNLLLRWLSLFRQPVLGAQVLVLPGMGLIVWRLVRTRRYELLLPLIWVLALPTLYAVRLPVDYQFGRYEMPIIPLIVIYGVAGTAELLSRIRARVIRRAWALTVAVLVGVFAWLGANQYARSTAIINCEMVATARWTAANLAPGALIAVHDIGAQAYFDSHPMLDLAGLVSPEVIPFIRDQRRLAEWMQVRGARYAIFFPSWYPDLVRDSRFVLIHSDSCDATRASGEVDLAVYEIR